MNARSILTIARMAAPAFGLLALLPLAGCGESGPSLEELQSIISQNYADAVEGNRSFGDILGHNHPTPPVVKVTERTCEARGSYEFHGEKLPIFRCDVTFKVGEDQQKQKLDYVKIEGKWSQYEE
ncbi:MAG: hypothetical protein ABF802_06265 [Acetobacter orientalis]|uniref:hypothetical protein n=1 Tax=Acetobacter orientalis TaxID=146474 RepID=UPI0039E92E2D